MLGIVFKNLLRRKLRTLFALLGVAMGILAMVALTAITEGTIYQFKKLVTDYRGDIIVQQAKAPDPVFSQVDLSLVEKLKTYPEVKDAHPIAFTATKIPGDEFFFILGLPGNSALLHRHKLIEGCYYKDDAREIVLGEAAAKQYKIRIGDSFFDNQFKVVGIYSVGIRFLDKACMMSLDNLATISAPAQLLTNPSQLFAQLTHFLGLSQKRKLSKVNMIVLDLYNPEKQTKPLILKIKEQFPEQEAMASPEYLNNFEQIELLQAMALVISIIAMSIATLGILNTMIMSVYERTREIGLLRSLGWSSRRILAMILGEGFIISLL
ncbi:MAG: ABC transporter permease, partial [Planctomycetota bacterium]